MIRIKLLSIVTFLFLVGCSTDHSHSGKKENISYQNQQLIESTSDEKKYENFLSEIERGNKALISSSPLFIKKTDAAKSLSLKYALSKAVKNNPDEVMKLIPESFSIKEICTIPYIEESIEVELEHINASILSLSQSTASTDAHSQCVSVYQTLKEKITKQ